MAFKLDNELRQIRIPHVDIEVKANTHDDFVALTVCNFSDSSLVALENLARGLGVVFEHAWVQVIILEVVLQDFLLFQLLLFGLLGFLRLSLSYFEVATRVLVQLLLVKFVLPQIPQADPEAIVT